LVERGSTTTTLTLRQAAVGALSGATAGALFGACLFGIQAVDTTALRARYGDNLVTQGMMPFSDPSVIIPIGLVGGFVGLLYASARMGMPELARGGGLVFAALLTLVLQVSPWAAYFMAGVSVFIARAGGTCGRNPWPTPAVDRARRGPHFRGRTGHPLAR